MTDPTTITAESFSSSSRVLEASNFSTDKFTATQQAFLEVTPQVTTTLSVLASAWIVIEIWVCSNKRYFVYHKLVSGMSAYSLVVGIGFYFSRNCLAQAILLQFQLGTALYFGILGVYYMLVISYSIPEDQLLQGIWEYVFHLIPLVGVLSTILAGSLMDYTYGDNDSGGDNDNSSSSSSSKIFGPVDPLPWCWIRKDSSQDKMLGWYPWSFYLTWAWLSLVIFMITLIKVFRSVKAQEQRMKRYILTGRPTSVDPNSVDGDDEYQSSTGGAERRESGTFQSSIGDSRRSGGGGGEQPILIKTSTSHDEEEDDYANARIMPSSTTSSQPSSSITTTPGEHQPKHELEDASLTSATAANRRQSLGRQRRKSRISVVLQRETKRISQSVQKKYEQVATYFAHLPRTKQVMWQAMWYVLAGSLSLLVITLGYARAHNDFWTAAVQVWLQPLQGLFIFVAYRRPTYLRYRRNKEMGTIGAMLATLKFDLGALSTHSSSSTSRHSSHHHRHGRHRRPSSSAGTRRPSRNSATSSRGSVRSSFVSMVDGTRHLLDFAMLRGSKIRKQHSASKRIKKKNSGSKRSSSSSLSQPRRNSHPETKTDPSSLFASTVVQFQEPIDDSNREESAAFTTTTNIATTITSNSSPLKRSQSGAEETPTTPSSAARTSLLQEQTPRRHSEPPELLMTFSSRLVMDDDDDDDDGDDDDDTGDHSITSSIAEHLFSDHAVDNEDEVTPTPSAFDQAGLLRHPSQSTMTTMRSSMTTTVGGSSRKFEMTTTASTTATRLGDNFTMENLNDMKNPPVDLEQGGEDRVSPLLPRMNNRPSHNNASSSAMDTTSERRRDRRKDLKKMKQESQRFFDLVCMDVIPEADDTAENQWRDLMSDVMNASLHSLGGNSESESFRIRVPAEPTPPPPLSTPLQRRSPNTNWSRLAKKIRANPLFRSQRFTMLERTGNNNTTTMAPHSPAAPPPLPPPSSMERSQSDQPPDLPKFPLPLPRAVRARSDQPAKLSSSSSRPASGSKASPDGRFWAKLAMEKKRKDVLHDIEQQNPHSLKQHTKDTFHDEEAQTQKPAPIFREVQEAGTSATAPPPPPPPVPPRRGMMTRSESQRQLAKRELDRKRSELLHSINERRWSVRQLQVEQEAKEGSDRDDSRKSMEDDPSASPGQQRRKRPSTNSATFWSRFSKRNLGNIPEANNENDESSKTLKFNSSGRGGSMRYGNGSEFFNLEEGGAGGGNNPNAAANASNEISLLSLDSKKTVQRSNRKGSNVQRVADPFNRSFEVQSQDGDISLVSSNDHDAADHMRKILSFESSGELRSNHDDEDEAADGKAVSQVDEDASTSRCEIDESFRDELSYSLRDEQQSVANTTDTVTTTTDKYDKGIWDRLDVAKQKQEELYSNYSPKSGRTALVIDATSRNNQDDEDDGKIKLPKAAPMDRS